MNSERGPTFAELGGLLGPYIRKDYLGSKADHRSLAIWSLQLPAY